MGGKKKEDTKGASWLASASARQKGRVMLYEKRPEILGVFRVLVHVLNTVV